MSTDYFVFYCQYFLLYKQKRSRSSVFYSISELLFYITVDIDVAVCGRYLNTLEVLVHGDYCIL